MTIVDPRTVVLLASIMTALMAMVLFFQWRNFPDAIRGLGNWTAAPLALCSTTLLGALRGDLPDLLTIAIPNMLLFVGLYLAYLGSQRFLNQPTAVRPWSAFIALMSVPVLWFSLIEPDFRTRLLVVITDPSIAYLLLMIGFYGLLFEFFNPGLVAPGVIGGICLLVALFALQLLPVSYTGLALMALGVGLLVAEHFAPGFGILGMGGITAFVIGSIMLIDTDAPGYRIPWQMIAGVTATSIGFLLVVLNLALRARRRPVVSGREQMIGATGEVIADTDGGVLARIHGEVWKVRANAPLGRGQMVRVVGIDGLVLAVEPASQGDEK